MIVRVIDNDNNSGEQFSRSSAEESSTQSYNGIIIKVYKESGLSPIITLGTELDSFENIYCFQFLRIFESLNYNKSKSNIDIDYDIIIN